MIRLYCSKDGELKDVDKTRLKEALWVDMVAPSPEEVEMMHAEFGVALQDVADCLDPNERARVEIEEGYDLVVLRCLLTDDKGDARIQMMPIGIIMTSRNVITVRLGATFAAHELTSDLKRRPRIDTKEDLFFALIRKVTKDMERKVRPMERMIGSIQESILAAKKAEGAHEAFALSNGLILLNTALLSNLNAVSMLPRAKQLKMTKDKMDVAEDLENDIAQLYEMTTIYREIMSNILNAYESAIANNLSTVMKTLTTISLILILPTLIASLFGMNVGLPLQGDDPHTFWFVIGLSAVAVAVLWVAFRLKRIL